MSGVRPALEPCHRALTQHRVLSLSVRSRSSP
ncbi:hypothetical protein LINPERHAP2_LOCUS10256 [Linum perenne]